MPNTIHKMTFRLITGKRVTITAYEYLCLLREPVFYLALLGPVAMNYAFHDAPIGYKGWYWLPAFLWFLVVVVTVLIYFSATFLLCFSELPQKIRYVYEPSVAAFTAFFSILFAGPIFVQANLFPPPEAVVTGGAIFMCFAAIEIAVLTYVYLLRTRHLKKYELNKTSRPQPIEMPVFIGGQRFNAAHLRYAKSENQYVRVFTDFGEELVLDSLKNIQGHLTSQEGAIVHRSYFVMRREVDKIVVDDDKQVLRLKDGTMIPLARRRLKEVRDWLSK